MSGAVNDFSVTLRGPIWNFGKAEFHHREFQSVSGSKAEFVPMFLCFRQRAGIGLVLGRRPFVARPYSWMNGRWPSPIPEPIQAVFLYDPADQLVRAR